MKKLEISYLVTASKDSNPENGMPGLLTSKEPNAHHSSNYGDMGGDMGVFTFFGGDMGVFTFFTFLSLIDLLGV